MVASLYIKRGGHLICMNISVVELPVFVSDALRKPAKKWSFNIYGLLL